MAKKCIFFALIFSGLRGCFSKNGVFAYKMNFVENFFERHKKIATLRAAICRINKYFCRLTCILAPNARSPTQFRGGTPVVSSHVLYDVQRTRSTSRAADSLSCKDNLCCCVDRA